MATLEQLSIPGTEVYVVDNSYSDTSVFRGTVEEQKGKITKISYEYYPECYMTKSFNTKSLYKVYLKTPETVELYCEYLKCKDALQKARVSLINCINKFK